MTRVPVLINREGGTAAARGDALGPEVEAAFEAAGLTIDLRLLRGCDITNAAAELSQEPLVVVGGGDGTIGGAAGALVDGGGATLGILALGTRNHLARALDLPLDLAGAAQAIARGRDRRIDLARVNGAAFVNNASVGFYPDLVRARDASRLSKRFAAIPATYNAVKRMRHHRMRLRRPDGSDEVVTPMLFVGNNRYALAAGRIGEREALADGLLSIYAVASRRRLALAGFALRTMLGRADPERDFAAIGDAAELTVTGRSEEIDIALDGEVRTLAMPLRFTIQPGALAVRVPAA